MSYMQSSRSKFTDMITAHPPAIGEHAPDFALDTPEGTTLSLRDLTADRTLVIFARHLG
jgi:hypothetical protein